MEPSPSPDHSCQVFAASALVVRHGVNLGEPLDRPDAVVEGDIYQLSPKAKPLRLNLRQGAGVSHPTIGEGSEVGVAGQTLSLQATYALLSDDADRSELILLDIAGALYALPRAPMRVKRDYTLISVDPAPEQSLLSDVLSVAFARGTRITMANGAQIRIERLKVGDMILTRDHGPQPLRHKGQATMRAQGTLAPVVIAPGYLRNSGTLIVSQHHRMFLYQRQRPEGFGQSELLIQARHLVDGRGIFLREGGFTDWFSLVFDQHEIIYAEAIPCESLMVTPATLPRLPQRLAEEVAQHLPHLHHIQHHGEETDRAGAKALRKTREGA